MSYGTVVDPDPPGVIAQSVLWFWKVYRFWEDLFRRYCCRWSLSSLHGCSCTWLVCMTRHTWREEEGLEGRFLLVDLDKRFIYFCFITHFFLFHDSFFLLFVKALLIFCSLLSLFPFLIRPLPPLIILDTSPMTPHLLISPFRTTIHAFSQRLTQIFPLLLILFLMLTLHACSSSIASCSHRWCCTCI